MFNITPDDYRLSLREALSQSPVRTFFMRATFLFQGLGGLPLQLDVVYREAAGGVSRLELMVKSLCCGDYSVDPAEEFEEVDTSAIAGTTFVCNRCGARQPSPLLANGGVFDVDERSRAVNQKGLAHLVEEAFGLDPLEALLITTEFLDELAAARAEVFTPAWVKEMVVIHDLQEEENAKW